MTRHALLLSLLLLFFCIRSAAQLTPSAVKIINDLKPAEIKHFPQQSYGKAASCGTDTIYYNYYKSSAFTAVNLNTSNSATAFAQWFPAPQPITVSGFDFYAWQSTGTSATVTITCNLYLAQSDSLPLGNPLRTVTVNVDSTFGGGLLSAMRKHAKFPTPITISGNYVITVETNSATSVAVICNSYTNGDGNAEWLAGAKITGSWRRSFAMNVGGQTFDADFILQPTVGYSLSADFFFAGCNEGNTNFTFTNTSSVIMQNKFYNRYAYYNIPQFGYQWDYGDTTFIQYALNGNHTYLNRTPYWVTLKDTFYGWTVGCADYITKQVPYRPEPPLTWNDGPVCSGDSLHLYAEPIAGVTYSWSGPKGFSSTKQNPTLYNTDTGMIGDYAVTAKYMTCVSDTSKNHVFIHQTPQRPVASNDGPKCVGDSVSFSAVSMSPGITYRWTGPNSFSDSSDTFRFYGLDTSDVGVYYVFVEDGNCVSDTDSTVLYTYPPPMAPEILSDRGDSLCQGDSLFLRGLSVIGAVFEWQGPNGFQSGLTEPLIVADDTAYSGLYVSKVLIGSCTSDPDSLWITVFPTPVTGPINGSDTSTEGYTKTYQTTKAPGDLIVWSCLGGTIESFDSITGTITVKWGNPGVGSLKMNIFNEHGCYGDYQQMEVDILKLPPPPDNTSLRAPENAAWKVYPNPGAGRFFVEVKDGLVPEGYSLYSIAGHLMQTGLYNENGIDCPELADGIYMLVLEKQGHRERHLVQVISR